mgnify:CR=1 FL=1
MNWSAVIASSAAIDCTAKALGMFDTARNQPTRVCAIALHCSARMLPAKATAAKPRQTNAALGACLSHRVSR